MVAPTERATSTEVGMSPTPKADVIVPVSRDRPLALPCLQAVLERSGPTLNRLIVVHDHGPESEVARDLQRFAARDSRVLVLTEVLDLGYTGRCNRGLDLRDGDAVLLAPDCVVDDGWLAELTAVAHSEERTACATPLTNVGGPCSVPELNR
jgi:GT2 family glycosyltransferase